MTYLAGKIVLAVTAGAPNNGAGSGTTAPVKKATVRGADLPVRVGAGVPPLGPGDHGPQGSVPSPTIRVGKQEGKAQKATTGADPASTPTMTCSGT